LQKFFEDRWKQEALLGKARVGIGVLAVLLALAGTAGRYVLAKVLERTERLVSKTVDPLEQTSLYGLELGRLGSVSSRPRMDSLEKTYAQTYLDSEDIRLFALLKQARRALETYPKDSAKALAAAEAFQQVVRKNGSVARFIAAENRRMDDLAGWGILLVALVGSFTCLGYVITSRRGEIARREREALVFSLIESAPDAIVIYDPELDRIVVANPAAERLFGIPEAVLVQMRSPRFAPTAHADDPGSTREQLAAIQKALRGETVIAHWTILDAADRAIRCEIRLSSLPGPGQRKLVRASFLDVTDRETAREALAKSEARFRTLVEESSIAIRVSRNGLPVYANRACLSLFGHEEMDPFLAIPVRESYHESTRPMLDERVRLRFARGTPMPEYDTVCLRKDGTPFHAHVWTTFEQDADGATVVGFLVDTTEQVKAREDLARSELRFRSLVDDASIAIRITFGDRMIYANQACIDLFGYPDFASFQAITSQDTYHPDDRERIMERFATYARGETPPKEFDGKCLKRDGTHFHVHASTALVNLAEGDAVVGFLVDTTESVHAAERENLQREQLIHADRMASLGVLLAGMAHEINNPNNLALFNADLLGRILSELEPVLDEHHERNPDFRISGIPYQEMIPEVDALVEGIRGAAFRIRDIIAGLKDFSRRNPISEHRLVDLRQVVQSSLLLVGNLVRKSTDHFESELAEGLPKVSGDAQQLEQVLVNLLTNACQALPGKDRRLVVRTRVVEPGNVEIEVEDEGVGIPQENLPKILDPFFTTKREDGGTGLGLSVSWAIVQAHRGGLQFLPREGGGTRAVLSLPLAPLEETT